MADFTPESASVLHAIKQQGQTAAIRPIVAAAVESIAQWIAEAVPEFDPPGKTQTVTLVPLPSSPQGMRKRGFQPAQLWARQIARSLESTGRYAARVDPLLEFAKTVVDQRGLSAEERHANLSGSMTLRPRASKLEGRALLIDDVVTTGATLAEGLRALGASSLECLGFLTFAETLLKTDISKPKWV